MSQNSEVGYVDWQNEWVAYRKYYNFGVVVIIIQREAASKMKGGGIFGVDGLAEKKRISK